MVNEAKHINEAHVCSGVSWTAIFTGALIAIGLSFLLNLFSVAIGLHIFTVNQGTVGLATGGFIGFVIGIIVTMLVAGYAAGYLGRLYCPQRNLGITYGFLTWTLALLLSAIVTAHLSNFLANYAGNVSNSLPTLSITNSQANGNKASVKNTTASATTTTTTGNKVTEVSVPGNALVWSAFSLFVLFFIGALSACIGGCWGMGCKKNVR